MGMCILVAAWTDPAVWLSFLKGAFGLGVVIFVHELGHFLVAKMCGVKCEKFYVGFDVPIKIGPIAFPRALFKKQWGETEYGIGIIPLGGYVKMLGQDDNPANASREAERIKIKREEPGDAAAPRDEKFNELPELDPRSYPAKSVPQRMAIISAGVVMNLIFAVVFATIAYLMGVSYTPCQVGATSVGDPAWVAGIQPGDRIIQLDRDGRRDDQLRFRQDLKVKMFSVDPGNDVELYIKRADGSERWVTLKPNAAFQKQVGTPTIGISNILTNRVGAILEGSAAEEAGVKPGDTITNVRIQGVDHPISNFLDLQPIMARYPTEGLTLTVERTGAEADSAPTTATVEVRPEPAKRVGIVFGMGPITTIQEGSVAEQAGLEVGDVLLAVDGQPVGDPLTLPDRLLDHIGEPTTLTVQRGNESRDIEVTPEAPRMRPGVKRSNGPVGAETLGIGYDLSPKVASVLSASPAAAADIQAGDEVTQVHFVLKEPTRSLTRSLKQEGLDGPIRIDEENSNWPYVLALSQGFPADFELELTLRRGSETKTVQVEPAASDSLFDTDRGIMLAGASEMRRAGSLGDAVALGVRETWEGISQVVLVLRRFKESYKSLGGPLTIAAVATMEASEGLPRLLVFLTLLSANLAVVNFLPIPVLDGGHMVFLAYEGLFGKPVNERVAFGLTLIGLSFILGLMVFVFGLDINRFLG